MPYAVAFNPSDAIVHVQVSGSATKEEHLAARDEALRLCREYECSKLLVDLREVDTRRFSIFGCFSFGEQLAKTSPWVRIAHVLPTDPKSREDVGFVSTVEANRGRSTGEFETVEEARAWLLEGK